MTEETNTGDKSAESVAGSTRFMLDKRIPLVALIGFLLQFGGVMWYASQLDSTVKALQAQSTEDRARIAQLEGKTGDLVLVNFRLTAVESTTNRIEAKVDAIGEKVR